MSSRIEALTIKEDVKEGEADDDEGLPVYPYDRLTILSMDPVTDIDVTKREVYMFLQRHFTWRVYIFSTTLNYNLFVPLQAYLSSQEFKEKFGMARSAFYKLPKWKQNKIKMSLQLF